MITFIQFYKQVKKMAANQGKTVNEMCEALLLVWYAEQGRLQREAVAKMSIEAPKTAPKKRGRPAKAKQLELEPPKRKRRSPSQEARRNISRGVQLSWAKRKLEQAGIK